ncbi:hypothetical protein BC628DRAFT_416030 [Trametes gibbosa]|nr:hypothetical protein BC628DRAFT_416030 [Trametes gibbosa]
MYVAYCRLRRVGGGNESRTRLEPRNVLNPRLSPGPSRSCLPTRAQSTTARGPPPSSPSADTLPPRHVHRKEQRSTSVRGPSVVLSAAQEDPGTSLRSTSAEGPCM